EELGVGATPGVGLTVSIWLGPRRTRGACPDVAVGVAVIPASGDVAGRACGWPQATPIKRRPRISRRMTHQRRAGAERYWSSGFRRPRPFRRVGPCLMQLVGSHISQRPSYSLLFETTIPFNQTQIHG